MKSLSFMALLGVVALLSACQTPPSNSSQLVIEPKVETTQSTTQTNTPTTPVYHTPSGTPINPTQTMPQDSPKKTSPNVQQPIPQTLKKVWRLTQMHGIGDDDTWAKRLASQPVVIDLTQAPKGYADAGCNQMNFFVNIKGDRFGFGQVSATRKLCLELMPLEYAIAKNITALRYYRLEGESLVLYSDDLQFVLIPHNDH